MQASAGETSGVLLSLSNDLAGAVERAGRATVAVNARQRVPSSGVQWRQGIVVTADHTVERDEDITVTLPDGRTVPATLAGRDPGTDLAVLKVQGAEWPAAEIGDAAHVIPMRVRQHDGLERRRRDAGTGQLLGDRRLLLVLRRRSHERRGAPPRAGHRRPRSSGTRGRAGPRDWHQHVGSVAWWGPGDPRLDGPARGGPACGHGAHRTWLSRHRDAAGDRARRPQEQAWSGHRRWAGRRLRPAWWAGREGRHADWGHSGRARRQAHCRHGRRAGAARPRARGQDHRRHGHPWW